MTVRYLIRDINFFFNFKFHCHTILSMANTHSSGKLGRDFS
jgi:hypothetical protein